MRHQQVPADADLLVALVILEAGGEPGMYLIPASAWPDAKPLSSTVTTMG
jgi:hypothetical protein